MGENVTGEEDGGLGLRFADLRHQRPIQMEEGQKNWKKQGWKLGEGSDLELYL